jgi:hypothetical protein
MITNTVQISYRPIVRCFKIVLKPLIQLIQNIDECSLDDSLPIISAVIPIGKSRLRLSRTQIIQGENFKFSYF